MYRLSLFVVFLVAILCAGSTSVPQTQEPVRLLFVGNSLTYVGNLPAVVGAFAATNQQPVQSDMIVEGGATLTQHLSDGSVERALLDKRYDYVVLQERRGDFICSFGPLSCEEAHASLDELTRLRTIADQTERAIREIGALVATVLSAEPDCGGITFLQDAADPTRLTLIEHWPSSAFLGPHTQQPHIQAFMRSAGAFLAAPPDISFLRPVGDT